MREIAARFFTELHKKAMKPMSFRKERARFFRENEDRTEIIDFQGSQWNSADSSWEFYINVAVGFHGIVNRRQKKLWFNQAHALGRIEGLVAKCPDNFYLDEKTYQRLLTLVPKLIKEALEFLPSVLPRARCRAENGWLSPLPVPDTWEDDPE
jgi:hypothetical protein